MKLDFLSKLSNLKEAGNKDKKKINETEPDKSGYIRKDYEYLMRRQELFQRTECKKETTDMVKNLLTYMSENGLMSIRLRADHHLTNEARFKKLRKAGRI